MDPIEPVKFIFASNMSQQQKDDFLKKDDFHKQMSIGSLSTEPFTPPETTPELPPGSTVQWTA